MLDRWNSLQLDPINWNVHRLSIRKGPISTPILSIFKLMFLKSYPYELLRQGLHQDVFRQFWLTYTVELLFAPSFFNAPHWRKIFQCDCASCFYFVTTLVFFSFFSDCFFFDIFRFFLLFSFSNTFYSGLLCFLFSVKKFLSLFHYLLFQLSPELKKLINRESYWRKILLLCVIKRLAGTHFLLWPLPRLIYALLDF